MVDLLEIDAAISGHASKVANLRRELEIAEAELRGMKMLRDQLAALAKPTATPPLPSMPAAPQSSGAIGVTQVQEDGGYRGGRQPGAISKTWREILSDIYWKTEGGTVPMALDGIIEVAARHGISLRPSDATNRMTHYVQFEYTSPHAEGGFFVTDQAAKKFGFDKEPLKNEAPSADAPEPQ